MDQGLTGHCHYGAVHLRVPRPPTHLTECHCTICRRYASLWAYYPKSEITLTGPTETYAWGPGNVIFHRCATCGCVMAWLPRGAYPECGINARMLDDFDLSTATLVVEADASV